MAALDDWLALKQQSDAVQADASHMLVQKRIATLKLSGDDDDDSDGGDDDDDDSGGELFAAAGPRQTTAPAASRPFAASSRPKRTAAIAGVHAAVAALSQHGDD